MNLTELHSFKLSDALYFHKDLNPAIFDGDRMNDEVRQQLLLIASDFIEHLGITDLDVDDITISGSNAAYTYTRHSDIDLHILVDLNKFADNDIYRELFDAKKIVYNDQHDIYINDYEVELYVQDANQPVISLGEYSVLHDKWIRLPRKRKANFDQNATKLKFEKLYKLAEFAYKSNNLHKIKNVLKNIKKYRQAGLDLNGEFGPENLAFKALRSKGVITKLYEKLNELHSKKLSLPESKLLDKPEMTTTQLAKKHNVSRQEIENQLKKGIKVEMEHTSKYDVAKEIALDHLAENPDYYSKLEKAELEEVFNTPTTNVLWDTSDPDLVSANFTASSGVSYRLSITAPYMGPDEMDPYDFFGTDINDNVYDRAKFVEFEIPSKQPYGKGKQGIENTGAAAEVFGIVTNALLQYAKKYKPSMLYFQGAEPNRARLYATIAKRMLRGLPGWGMATDRGGHHIALYNKRIVKSNPVTEASGYIPSEKEKNDPRFKTALTDDVKPDAIKKNANAFGFKVSRAGIPPLLRK